MSEYDLQAEAFLKTTGLKLSIRRAVNQDSPSWPGPHGVKYLVTLRRGISAHIEFPFWDSLHNMETNQTPSAYDVLACISSDSSMPLSADEVYAEFGEMKPSDCERIARFADRLRAFFTAEELTALQKIA